MLYHVEVVHRWPECCVMGLTGPLTIRSSNFSGEHVGGPLLFQDVYLVFHGRLGQALLSHIIDSASGFSDLDFFCS